jgi:hypothetical protein
MQDVDSMGQVLAEVHSMPHVIERQDKGPCTTAVYKFQGGSMGRLAPVTPQIVRRVVHECV